MDTTGQTENHAALDELAGLAHGARLLSGFTASLREDADGLREALTRASSGVRSAEGQPWDVPVEVRRTARLMAAAAEDVIAQLSALNQGLSVLTDRLGGLADAAEAGEDNG